MNLTILLDSNCYTYFLDAISWVAEPENTVLNNEKIALVKLYLYADIRFLVSKTIQKEYSKITDDKKYRFHTSTNSCLVDTLNVDESKVKIMADEFIFSHNSKGDCKILAEAILGRADYLLTCDKDFINKLSPFSASSDILKPSELLSKLNIKSGAKPLITSCEDNPLNNLDFWKI